MNCGVGSRFRREVGFTLIELVVVVAIIGILASIAVIAYGKYLQNAERADAEAVLMENAHRLERIYTANNAYPTGSPCPDLPVAEAPLDGSKKYYNITMTACDGTSYTMRATPRTEAGAVDLGGGVVDYTKSPGLLELTSTGAKRRDRNLDGDFNDTDETKW